MRGLRERDGAELVGGELREVEVDAADGTVLDVETAEDFAQEFEDDGTEEDGDAA